MLFSFFPVFSQSLPRLMENCYTSSGKIFPLDVLALTLCTKNQQVQVRLKRKQVRLKEKYFSARRVTIFHQTWSLKIISIFQTFTPTQKKIISFLAQSWHFKHILCYEEKKMTSNLGQQKKQGKMRKCVLSVFCRLLSVFCEDFS